MCTLSCWWKEEHKTQRRTSHFQYSLFTKWDETKNYWGCRGGLSSRKEEKWTENRIVDGAKACDFQVKGTRRGFVTWNNLGTLQPFTETSGATVISTKIWSLWHGLAASVLLRILYLGTRPLSEGHPTLEFQMVRESFPQLIFLLLFSLLSTDDNLFLGWSFKNLKKVLPLRSLWMCSDKGKVTLLPNYYSYQYHR